MRANPFMHHIYAALAEQERRMISARTSAALKAAKARGVVLGNPHLARFGTLDGLYGRPQPISGRSAPPYYRGHQGSGGDHDTGRCRGVECESGHHAEGVQSGRQ